MDEGPKLELEGNMSFWDHLESLRQLLFRVIGIWVILGIVYFIFMPFIFDNIILGPCHNDFIFYQWLRELGSFLDSDDAFFTLEQDIELQNINLAAPFLIRCSASFMLAVVTTVPYLLWEIWLFIRPALFKDEAKGVRKALFLGAGMFFVGVLVGYIMVFPLVLRFLVNYELSSFITTQLTLDSYMDNFMMLVICMGLAFELPLVTWLLSLMGLVNREFLRKYRRHAIVIIIIAAAIITPTGDPFTLTIVSLPLYLLYELSFYLIKE